MSRWDTSAVHDLEQLVCLVAQCVIDQDNGFDVLASAPWDRVREWVESEPHYINEAASACSSEIIACHTCGKLGIEPDGWQQIGECASCSNREGDGSGS